MFEHDSFNDSSETFNLYSSKKVADIYNTQLLNLISNKSSTVNGKVSPEQDTNSDISNVNKCSAKLLDEELISERKREEDPNNLTVNNSDVVELSDGSVDDASVEIVEEVDRPGVRRSLRIRNKNNRSRRRACPSENASNHVSLRKSKKKTKRKKGKQADTEEVVVDESLNESPKEELDDELNPEVSVKIIWKSVGIKKFKIRKFQKMSKIYQDLSREENVPETQILLTFKSVKINQNDTPSSLNLQIYDFLEGGILSEAACQNSEKVTSELHTDDSSDGVMLKFQDCNKKSVKIFLNETDKMKVGMIKYSEQMEIPLENIKFFFDGELLDPNETPQALGLDRDDIVDVKIVR